MSVNRVEQQLLDVLNMPEFGSEEYEEWLECKDVLGFLARRVSGMVPLYVSAPGLYMYSVLVPESLLSGDYVADVMSWSFGPDLSWGYGESYEDGRPKKQLFSPLAHTRSDILGTGDKDFRLSISIGQD